MQVRLGIVGTGFIAQEVIPQLRKWGIEPEAVCGTPHSADVLENLCSINQISEHYFDYENMLSEANIDTVYIAIPNNLHFEFSQRALQHQKHVIIEKPMTSNLKEAEELFQTAERQKVFLFEAISTIYLENYRKIQEWLPRIGEVRIVMLNFSQYSRRYDAFRNGDILPAFDPGKSGGALMDLNSYNLHYMTGLFGSPQSVSYYANIERGIDTSGIVMLDYGAFKGTAIAAKDCHAPSCSVIQGTNGYISQDTPANICGKVTLHMNDGTEEYFDAKPESRLTDEFRAFISAIDNNDSDFFRKMMKHSIEVSKIITQARYYAGISFPADIN